MVTRVNLYVTGGRAYHNAYFGAGSGAIFLDDVQCISSSSQLLECPSRPILSHNCLHSDDAGVGCEGMFDMMMHDISFNKSVKVRTVHLQLKVCHNIV